jgi:hypothetical protein|uniref:Calcineurin-like phosphoesterase domain-containing protein n=1 Tax=viral metagenome TaxID=1070528 RepID=A0A6C0M114_9ZZZZ
MVKYKLIYKYKNQEYNCSDKVIIPAPDRLIAIGDIHGDIELMLDSLLVAGLIKEEKYQSGGKIVGSNLVPLIYKDGVTRYYSWIGGNTIVVQVGDQIDRCRPFFNTEQNTVAACNDEHTTFDDEASDERILVFLSDLDKLARKYGGALYNLLGNHELMNMMGNMDYVSYMGLKEYVDINGRIKHFERGSDMSKFIACTRSAVVVIGSYLFVHAGFLSNVIKNYKHLDKSTILSNLNTIYHYWIVDKSNEVVNVLKKNYSKEEVEKLIVNINSPIHSPLWVRGLGNIRPNLPKDHENCEDVNKVLDLFALKGMVVGHTPQMETGINGTCGNSLFRVDVASSRAFTSMFKFQNLDVNMLQKLENIRQPQVLEIIKDTDVYVINKNGRFKIA